METATIEERIAYLESMKKEIVTAILELRLEQVKEINENYNNQWFESGNNLLIHFSPGLIGDMNSGIIELVCEKVSIEPGGSFKVEKQTRQYFPTYESCIEFISRLKPISEDDVKTKLLNTLSIC